MATSTPPPPPPPDNAPGGDPPRPQQRLARPKDDRVVSGVAAGIATHFGVDPVWVRVLFVVGAFMAGIGLVVYVVLAFAMPQVEHSPPPGQPSAVSPTVFWVGAGVALFLAGTTVNAWPRAGLLVPIAIVAIGIALWQRPGQSQDAGTSAVPPPTPSSPRTGDRPPGADGDSSTVEPRAGAPAAAATPAPSSAVAAVATGTADAPTTPRGSAASGAPAANPERAPQPPPPTEDEVWWTPPAPRQRPSWLGPVTLGIAIVVAIVQAALDGLDVINVTPTQFFATGLLILGAGMVIGAFWGRAKWLVAPAVVLAAGLLVVQTSVDLGIEISPNVRTGTYAADEVAGVPSGVIGDITIDLADGPVPSTVAFDQGAGELTVVVPWNADVDLSATVGVGQVEVFEVGEVEFTTTAEVESGETSGRDPGSWPREWDRGTARVENAVAFSFDDDQSDVTFDVVDESTGEVLGFGALSSDARSLAQGVDLAVESLSLSTPWSPGTTLDLDLGMGAGSIQVMRAAPPDNVLASTLEDR